jgi:hypothetical protein
VEEEEAEEEEGEEEEEEEDPAGPPLRRIHPAYMAGTDNLGPIVYYDVPRCVWRIEGNSRDWSTWPAC